MSRRTAEAIKAIRLAWEREQELVQQGNGTRDWTRQQQTDILDPDKGKAYDEDGRAFEGQHMRSVEEHPEYQGNPDNIQFLTKKEHLEAHKGSWKNPTNWYYDPATKEFSDFGDGDIIPCKVIKLSEPISIVATDAVPEEENHKENIQESEREKRAGPEPVNEKNSLLQNQENKVHVGPAETKIAHAIHIPRKENGFVRGIKTVGKFIVEHPWESLEIAGVFVGGVAKIISSVGGKNSSNSTYTSSDFSDKSEPDITTQVKDIVEKANRASPHENDVPAHKQRYHTKDGVVWRDKAPYHRGGKDE